MVNDLMFLLTYSVEGISKKCSTHYTSKFRKDLTSMLKVIKGGGGGRQDHV